MICLYDDNLIHTSWYYRNPTVNPITKINYCSCHYVYISFTLCTTDWGKHSVNIDYDFGTLILSSRARSWVWASRIRDCALALTCMCWTVHRLVILIGRKIQRSHAHTHLIDLFPQSSEHLIHMPTDMVMHACALTLARDSSNGGQQTPVTVAMGQKKWYSNHK